MRTQPWIQGTSAQTGAFVCVYYRQVKDRLTQTTRNMLMSFGVVFALIAFIYFFTYTPVTGDPVKIVDYTPTLAAVRSSGAFKVDAPIGLSPDWRATSVRYTPAATDSTIATWHLGFVTPDDGYVGLEQSNGTDAGFVKDSTTRGQEVGTQLVEDKTWKKYHSDSTGYNALVLKEDDVTTVVAGTLSYDQLATFIGTLRSS